MSSSKPEKALLQCDEVSLRASRAPVRRCGRPVSGPVDRFNVDERVSNATGVRVQNGRGLCRGWDNRDNGWQKDGSLFGMMICVLLIS